MHSAFGQHPQQTEIDCIKEMVQENYESIKAETSQIVAEELEQIKERSGAV